MKKKILSLLLATFMLMSCFVACGEKELTAEEYFRESMKITDADKALISDMNSVKLTAGVGDVSALLANFTDVSGMPAIEDVVAEFVADSEKGTGFVTVDGIVNGAACDLDIGVDMKEGLYTFSSSLLSKVYGAKIEDIAGETLPFSLDDLNSLNLTNATFEIYPELVDAIVTNATLTKADGEKGMVVVSATYTSKQIADMAYDVLVAMKDNKGFSDYFNMLGASLDELIAEIDADKEAFYEPIEEIGIGMNLTLTINKKTKVAETAVLELVIDGETVTITASESATSGSCIIDAKSALDMYVTMDYTCENNNLTFNLDATAEDVEIAFDIEAKDGKGTVKISYDDGYEETEVSVGFDYTVNGKAVALTVTEVGVGPVSLDLSSAEITLGFETGASVPALPAPDQMLTDFSEYGDFMVMINELLMNFMMKTGIAPY